MRYGRITRERTWSATFLLIRLSGWRSSWIWRIRRSPYLSSTSFGGTICVSCGSGEYRFISFPLYFAPTSYFSNGSESRTGRCYLILIIFLFRTSVRWNSWTSSASRMWRWPAIPVLIGCWMSGSKLVSFRLSNVSWKARKVRGRSWWWPAVHGLKTRRSLSLISMSIRRWSWLSPRMRFTGNISFLSRRC